MLKELYNNKEYEHKDDVFKQEYKFNTLGKEIIIKIDDADVDVYVDNNYIGSVEGESWCTMDQLLDEVDDLLSKSPFFVQVGEKLVQVGCTQPIINEMSLDEYNDKISDKNKFDKFLSFVTKAYTDNEKAVYEVSGIEKYRVYFDGSAQVWVGNHWSERLKHYKSLKDHHCTLNVTVGRYQIGVTVERLIKVAHDIEMKSLPYELHNMIANVMDLSGNEFIADKLDVYQDFNLDNLEWTPNQINVGHPRTVLQIKELTNKLYRIPANDFVLPQVITTHPEVVQEYLDKAGYKVVKEYNI